MTSFSIVFEGLLSGSGPSDCVGSTEGINGLISVMHCASCWDEDSIMLSGMTQAQKLRDTVHSLRLQATKDFMLSSFHVRTAIDDLSK